MTADDKRPPRPGKELHPAVQAVVDAELAALGPGLEADVSEVPWAPLLRRLRDEWVDPRPPHHNSSLTLERAEKMVRLVAMGCFHELAYALGGVSVDTVHRRWFAAARDGVQPFALLRETLDQAALVAQWPLVARIYRASVTDWRAALALLERRYPDQWGVKKQAQQGAFGSADPRLHGGPASPERLAEKGGAPRTLELLPPLPELSAREGGDTNTDTHTSKAAAGPPVASAEAEQCESQSSGSESRSRSTA